MLHWLINTVIVIRNRSYDRRYMSLTQSKIITQKINGSNQSRRLDLIGNHRPSNVGSGGKVWSGAGHAQSQTRENGRSGDWLPLVISQTLCSFVLVCVSGQAAGQDGGAWHWVRSQWRRRGTQSFCLHKDFTPCHHVLLLTSSSNGFIRRSHPLCI